MELNTILEKRRSIRKFQAGRKVSEETIRELIQAAIQAPSWKNSQTARYYVVTSEKLLEEVRQECLPAFNQASSGDAPALIVTTFVHSRSGFERDGSPSNELGNQWGAYDLGLHNQNLILKAAELGLGTLIMGIRDGEKLRELLEIPETETVVAVIALGCPDVSPEKPKRKSVDEITKFY